MKTILAPIDFSDATPPVIAEAVALARAVSARLLLLHVVQPPLLTGDEFGAQMSAEYAASASETAAKRLAELQRQLQTREGATVETQHVIGLPGERIVELSRALEVDYIVLGSHGHGAFYELIIGSTTSRVLKQASCPLVIVPPKKAKSRR
jgi:universal stress protein A